MPSMISVMLREQLRLLKPLLSKLSISSDRAVQDKIGDMGARVLSAKLESAPVAFPNFEAEMITPHGHPEKGVILYLHGGGYTAGSLKYAHGFGSVLANRTNLCVLCAAYRLAPENPYPAALEDAYAAYRYLLEHGYPESEIFFVGESAGGGLIFCLAQYLKSRGEALPAKIVGISPWADLRMVSESCTENEKTDPVLTKEQLSHYAALYAGEKLTDPCVSPVCGDFTGFPPALLFAGGDEILLDDSILLKSKYEEAGASCELVIEEGLWHVYVLFAVPEAQAALEKIDQFLKVEKDGETKQALDEA
ncbi:alpha/beta hydrolase [Clostridiales bacterium NSJ-40]|uniref:Alpha/beta hydrolase n=2 Tax=Yeguia hominis TaxID=2763662 RepID=A0A926D9X0_9FIRM|nr:alpha/beta hydrolase [Yeguia hominis]